MLDDKRIRIVTGHYGSGKTEFSVNYAVELAKIKRKVALVDLDVINLYFRSREKSSLLENMGIKVISSSINAPAVDVPAISGEVYAPLEDESYDVVLDLGGDPAGARVLGRYEEFFVDGKYDMFYILNANRQETSTADKAIEYLKRIENMARIKVTALVNNTHMLKSTTVDDLLRGQKVALEVSEKLDIPIKYISVIKNVAALLPKDMKGEIFPMDLYMREEWMV
ncbi:ATP-binding protein [Sporanaerobacter sp. PP17-6a]|jgi:hypothetical protein|uniref:ATP-binding protein n=1 Tax=Sporanaerobacter sp. PP17-6a TaxID=1891289 RepID=UPI0008A013E6|nr:ATP-binding protein [Sporanaerobacter sp. PP17-6a]SCL94082.1 Septum formation inhibitor-activating ATPase [Sporanaerobacter sp. PP17-6a]